MHAGSPPQANSVPAGLSGQVDCEPERLAKSLLRQASAISAEQILSLFDALPRGCSNRSDEGASFGAGAFVRVGVGLRQSCKAYPNSIMAVNRFAQGVVDSLHYTSFVILDNNLAKEHKDSQNAHLPNVVVPLSSFSGGDIVVKAEGQEVILNVSQGPVSFCAREHAHYVTPFQGRRVILVLFSLKGCMHLSDTDRACLVRLGFPLPTEEDLASQVVLPPRVLFGPERPAKSSSMLGCNSLKHQGPSHGDAPPAKVPRLVPDLGRQVPLLVELCAGSAILSSVALASGWDVIPIDQSSCRFSPHTPLVILDLRDPLCVDLLLRFDQSAPVDWFHLGLPCGTCSRARERALPGNQGARPLRGPDDLFGFANLKPFEASQVEASNSVYRACIRILLRAFETGALVTIENPVEAGCGRSVLYSGDRAMVSLP